MNLEQLLKFAVEQGASAIHLQAEASPRVLIGGLIRFVEASPLHPDELKAFIASIAPRSVGDDIKQVTPAPAPPDADLPWPEEALKK
jgi:Tfp pilus assembly pilus retraction ATPase PilT